MTERRRRLVTALTLVVVAALAAGASIAEKQLTGIALVLAACAASAAVLAPQLLARLEKRRERMEARSDRISDLLSRWPLTPAEAHPAELGVSESRIAHRYATGGQSPPYVPREQDDRLSDALLRETFVIVVGPSKAGKSRTAFEAMLSERLRHRPLIVPRRPSENPKAIRELVALDPPLETGTEPPIIWLDDLQDYLLASGLDVTTLRRWRALDPPPLVLATIREGALADLRALESESSRGSAEPIAKAIGDVLDHGKQVALEANLTVSELRLANERYPDQDFSQGLGARLIDAPRLVDRFRTGRARCPAGVAVVRAAVDWRRAGAVSNPTADDIGALYGCYALEGPASTADLERGVAWAQERLESGASLLRLAPDGCGLVAHDYIEDSLNGRTVEADTRAPIPGCAWEAVVARGAPRDLLGVGFSASRDPTLRRFDVAEQALRKAAAARDPDVAPMAALYLGALLVRQEGREREAEAPYRQAAASRHVDAAPSAALNLGVLLEGHDGREREAEALYRQAVASGHPEVAPRAAMVLGLLLAGQDGRAEEAEAEFQRVVQSGHPGAARVARTALRRLQRTRGKADRS